MAAVNALKKIVEAPDDSIRITDPEQCLLEIFCVDTSISMARSQTFPYIFGESKLSLCKRIISKGFALPDQCSLYTALVKFNAGPSLAIPFALHTTEQNDQIKASLSQTEHQKGSAIYTSYAFCEKTISEFQQQHGLQGCKVLIHLFTDGIDNGSDEEDVAKYNGAIEVNSEGLRQSFLYSFDTAFEQSSALAKTLQAHLVTIHESELNTALEERDRWVLKFLASKPKISKAHKGFNLAKGYTPDMASVYNVLQKTYRFFASGKSATSKEGLFRVNANVHESKRLASQLLSNTEHLNDFEDSILVAHALKTALANGPPILPPLSQHVVIEVSRQPKEVQFGLLRPKIAELPQLNRECLHILLFLLHIVARDSLVNKMTSTNLAVIFTYLLFPDLLVPNPGLQELVVSLIDECQQIFPQPPLFKPTAASSSANPTPPITLSPSSSSTHLASTDHSPISQNLVSTSLDYFDPTGFPSAPPSSKSFVPVNTHTKTEHVAEEAPPRVKRAQTTNLRPSPHEALLDSHSAHSHPNESTDAGPSTHNEESTQKATEGGKVKRAESAASSLHRPLPPHLRTSIGSLSHPTHHSEVGDHLATEVSTEVENDGSSQMVGLGNTNPTPTVLLPRSVPNHTMAHFERHQDVVRPVPPNSQFEADAHTTTHSHHAHDAHDTHDEHLHAQTHRPSSNPSHRLSAPPPLAPPPCPVSSAAPSLPLPTVPSGEHRSTIGPISSGPAPTMPPPSLPH
jgi:hypothetical protein